MAYLSRDFEPNGTLLDSLLTRNIPAGREVEKIVSEVLASVKKQGDTALFAYEKTFDKVELETLIVSPLEFAIAEEQVSQYLKDAIQLASDNIRSFHQVQMPKAESLEVMEGVFLARRIVPLDKVGLYIPGGTAPLFSTVLMLAIPAKVAGCKDIVLCTPPRQDGSVHPAILYAAQQSGVGTVYKVGGAQAIAALAYGTETIDKVDKIFGPGNQYVMAAKIQVSSECCSIDMPAGPSEVMVVATPDADPSFVASDMLSQAEHGKDSQAMLVVQADREEGFAFIDKVEAELSDQIASLGRHEYLLPSLSHSHALVARQLETVASMVNAYGPEHLIINTTDPGELEPLIRNAGSLFLGPWSCESAGDYASGTNHTLPTNGWAHSYSGVSVDSFIKKLTIQTLTRKGLENLGPTIETMAEAEQLPAHKNAVTLRLGRKA
ncbi:histidinol dehydrogenase [uncultured Sphaerochaeta sp.]|uniref:histidinol dehydrogenase n=1 Tax=uncultured Sphaerochaeta sp. TaxID=886478 RepID=UPI002A0A4C77|nr:histidinol dehydrogenase [uncultured Sphaerochaeta sp.]